MQLLNIPDTRFKKIYLFQFKLISVFLVGILVLGCSQKSTEQLINMAEKEISQNKIDMAIITLKNAVTNEPTNPEIRVLLGQSYLKLGLFAEAEKELRRALDFGVTNNRVGPLLIKALYYQYFLDQAAIYAEQFTSQDQAALSKVKLFGWLADLKSTLAVSNMANTSISKDIVSHDKSLQQAYIHFSLGELPEALKQLESLPADFEKLETLLLKGMIYAANRDLSQSEVNFKKAIELVPKYYIAYYQISEVLIKSGKLQEAQKYVSTILELNDQHAYSNLLNAQISFRKNDFKVAFDSATKAIQNGIDTPFSNLIAGISSYQLGNLESAYRHLNKIKADIPANHYGKRILVELKLRLGETDGLKELANQLTENRDSNSDLMAASAISMFRQGDIKDAIEFFEKSNDINPNNSVNLMREGLIKISVKDYSGIKVLEKAIEQDEKSKYAWSLLAQAHLENGDSKEALATADKWKEINNLEGRTLKAYLLLQLNKSDEARQLLEQVIQETPNHTGATRFLMLLNARERKFELARPLAEQLILLDNQNFQYYIDLINISIAQGEGESIENTLLKLIESHTNIGDSTVIKTALGTLYNYQQKFNKTVKLLSNIKPLTDERALTLLGDTFFTLKDYATAYQIYNDLLGKNPDKKSNWLKIFAVAESTRNYSFGLKATQQAQQTFQNDVDIDAYEAIFLIKNRKLESANKLIKKLELEQPDLPLLSRLNGEVLLIEEDYSKAKPLLTKYYNTHPNLHSAQLLAEAFANTGDVIKGAEFIQNELSRSYAISTRDQHYLAEFYSLYGAFQESAKIYVELLEKDAGSFITLNNYASILIELEQFEKAFEIANKALNVIPNSSYALDTAGWALMQQGKTKEALYYLDKAYKQLASNPQIQMHMVEALYEDGQISKARSIYKKISPRNSKEKEWQSKYRNSL